MKSRETFLMEESRSMFCIYPKIQFVGELDRNLVWDHQP